MELTEIERTRIQLEESYRQEIRIQQEKRKKLTIWTVANSAFGLWFLSTVVVGLVTATWSWQSQRVAARNAYYAQTNKLWRELSARLFDIQLNAFASDNGANYVDLSVGSIYPEFEKRTFRSLAGELRAICPNSNTRDLYDAAATLERVRPVEGRSRAETWGGALKWVVQSLNLAKPNDCSYP